MPRDTRLIIPNICHHALQRGNNRQDVFYFGEAGYFSRPDCSPQKKREAERINLGVTPFFLSILPDLPAEVGGSERSL